MTNPQGPTRPDDDLDPWIDEMAGRRPPSNEATRALREVIQRDSSAETDHILGDAASPEAQRRAVDRLREGLRQARVMREAQMRGNPAPDGPSVVRTPRGVASNERRWRLVATFGMLALAVGVLWQFRPGEDGDFKIADGGATVWRDLAVPPRIAVERPAKAAQALAKEVAPFGGRPALYREGATILVDFEVQPGQAKALTTGVGDARIRAVIRLGANRVIFEKAPG